MMGLQKGAAVNDHLDRDGLPLFRNGPQKELISWQFPPAAVPCLLDACLVSEQKKKPLSFSFGRSLLFTPIVLFVSYMTAVSPVNIATQLSFLLPGWAGVQAWYHMSDSFPLLPESVPNDTVLWQIPFSLSFSFPFAPLQEAPWVQAWMEWWETEFRSPTAPHYMFEASAVRLLENRQIAWVPNSYKSYMFQEEMDEIAFSAEPAIELVEIHQPVILKKVAVKESAAPQKFVKQMVATKAPTFKSELKAARLALMSKDPHGAIQALKTIPAKALTADHLSVLAAAYQMTGEHDLSIDTYWKLLHLKPEEGRAWVGLSISLEAIHDTKNAIIGYKKALGYPLDPKVRAHVEHQLHRLGA